MKILIVEDDDELREYLQVALRAEGFEVDVADNGLDGLNLGKMHDYNLILLDYVLPKLNGDRVCELLRQDKKTVPILCLSVKDEVKDVVGLLNLGADDYLAKPFSLEELLARIQALLRRPTLVKSEIIKIDDLEIDIAKHEVVRGEKKIVLTNKEFSLLEYLARNQGYVVSRSRIIENVWDMNADLFSNSIEVHVFNLRKKINLRGHKPLIYTVSGRGYKLELIKS